MALEQDERIVGVLKREQARLRNFIRRRVRDAGDAEDILQDVFYELVEANRLLMPIDHVTAWLEGRSFQEIAAETGASVNTLLSRKRYAVLRLRERLQSIYEEFTKARGTRI